MNSSAMSVNLNRAKEVESRISLALTQAPEKKREVFDGILIESLHDKKVAAHHLADLMLWLRNSDFYRAPASSRFHEDHEGGLLHHSLLVAFLAAQMYQNQVYQNSIDAPDINSVLIAALLHDVCKIDYYKQTIKNVKNADTGSWEKKIIYEVKRDRSYYLGHGEQSCIILARKLPELDYKILEAIRWHMGLWEPGNQNDYSNAFRTNPLVSLVQFADAISVSDWKDV